MALRCFLTRFASIPSQTKVLSRARLLTTSSIVNPPVVNSNVENNVEEAPKEEIVYHEGKFPEPLVQGELDSFLKDPFITPQVATVRMYRDLITGVAKMHLPDAMPLKFPTGYFDRIRKFCADFSLNFKTNELLLRAFTHKSYAITWICPQKREEGWWKSPTVVKASQQYAEVINITSNASMSVLGQSLLFFLAQSYLFQKYPTMSADLLIKESRALVYHPLVASLGSAHFLLTTNKLLLFDSRGNNEEVTEEIIRSGTYALLAAVYLDGGIGVASKFAGEHIFPALVKLRDSVELLQKSHVDLLAQSVKAIHLLPHYRVKEVLNEGTFEAEYIVSLYISGIEMATGRATSVSGAKNNAAKSALKNPALLNLLPVKVLDTLKTKPKYEIEKEKDPALLVEAKKRPFLETMNVESTKQLK